MHTLKEERVAMEKGQVSFSFIKAKKDKLPYLVSHRMADKVGTENLKSSVGTQIYTCIRVTCRTS